MSEERFIRLNLKAPKRLVTRFKKLLKRQRKLTKVKTTLSGEIREAMRDYIRKENLALTKAEKGVLHAKPRDEYV